jgi:hypothetical protein
MHPKVILEGELAIYPMKLKAGYMRIIPKLGCEFEKNLKSLISILNISLVVNNCRENIVCLIVGQLNA